MECIRWFLCVTGMSLVSTYDDLSYQKYATQSTTYTGPYNSSKAGNAVDGDLTTCTRTKAIGVTSQDKRVTWQVDLGDVYSIHSINIVFRNYDGFEMRQRGRFAGFSLYISNTGIMEQGSLVYKDGPLLPPLNFTTTCFTYGRYVIFYNDRLDVDNYPSGYEDPVYTELCEVTVLGCQSGVYGNNCDAPCPTTCGERFCHTQNGTCFSCNPGAYGRNCEVTCPTNCKEHFCKMLDGSCLTCKPGWTGLFCNTKCMEGWYGENCKSKCPGQCQQNATCNHVTGWCDVGCAVGWTGLFCNIEKIDISRNKYATQSNTAVGTTYSAHNAVDRDVTTCMRTKDIGLNSSNKEVWWKVDLGKRYAIQGVSIMFKNYEGKEMRQRGRLAGFSIYLSTTRVINDSFVCYKDGPLLPSLNFTTDCIGSGRYVIFFNERLSGISYPEGYETTSVTTELCEVIVQGCENPGVYGRDCDDPCPQNCEDSRCHLLNGTCLSCKPGFMGTLCTTKCKPGWYGDGCNQQCSGNCKVAPCNHVTGHCDGGCTSGWNGTFCLEECFKSFGENCQNPCSQHCYDQECNIHNGSCLTGCTDNFYGTQCDKDILSKPDRSPASCEEAPTLWFYCGTISLAVNLMFIAGVCVYIWRVYSIKPALSCKQWRCADSSLYTEPGASSEEDSHYLTVVEQRKPKNV